MGSYDKSTYPKSRVATFDVGKIGINKHHITGFIEIDITKARKKIKQRIKSGENISLISWLIKVIGKTIQENRYIHSLNYKKRTQITFHDIDISLPIERTIDGNKVPLAMLIKEVNKKSIEDIFNEIKSGKNTEVRDEKDFVLSKKSNKRFTGLFFNLPQFLRLKIWKYILKDPFRVKKNMGTAMITNVGVLGNISGWVLPKSIHNLSFAMGSIIKKPWVVDNQIVIRNILHLTILFDHDAVDGSPAAKFTGNLVRNIENAEEL